MKAKELLDPTRVLFASGPCQVREPASPIESFEQLHARQISTLLGTIKIPATD